VKDVLPNWLALYRTPGVGSAKFKQCLLAEPELINLPAWVKPDWAAVARDLQWLQQKNCYILTLQDPRYPVLLKEITNSPPILFVQGNIELLNNQQIAVVGSRHPSSQGLDTAYSFANHLTELGFTITSGLALGIDAAGHRGALAQEHGKTLAVLGCGLDQIYPAVNKKLAYQIIENGALISEFPIGVAPQAQNFPQRNRIISGLSLGVLVVEAAIKSGALITANIAAEQGREVFAIPGSIHNAQVKGCHKLIRQGAKLVESTEDVLEELSGLLRPVVTKSCIVVKNKGNISINSIFSNEHSLDKEYLELLSYIDGMTSVDELVIRSGYLVQKVSCILMQLELDGYITAVPGGYIRC